MERCQSIVIKSHWIFYLFIYSFSKYLLNTLLCARHYFRTKDKVVNKTDYTLIFI